MFYVYEQQYNAFINIYTRAVIHLKLFSVLTLHCACKCPIKF